MPAPLLNDYKIRFAINRIFSTISGGPKIAPPDSPFIHVFILIFISLTVYILPLIASIIIYYVFENSWTIDIVVGVIFMAIHVVVRALDGKEPTIIRNEKRLGFLNENNQGLEGNPVGAALDYNFKKGWQPVVIQLVRIIIAGGFITISLNFFGGEFFKRAITDNILFLMAFVWIWIVISMAHWSLIGQRPVDPNTYHTEDKYDLDDYSRILVVTFAIFVRFLSVNIIDTIRFDVYVIIGLGILPILWSCGIIPSFRILFIVILERTSTILLGNSPTLTNRQLATNLAFKIILVGISTVSIKFCPTIIAIAIILSGSCLLGYRFILQLVLRKRNPDYKISFKKTIQRDFLFYLQSVLSIGLGIVAYAFSTSLTNFNTIVWYVLIAILFLLKTSREMQQIFIPSLFPILKNPFASHTGKRMFSIILGKIHRIVKYLLPIILTFATALACSFGYSSDNLQQYSWYNAIWTCITLIRLFSIIWTFSELTLLSLIIALASISSLDVIPFPSRMILIDLCITFLYRLQLKTGFWILCLKQFFFNRKERHKKWPWFFLPIMVISPISILLGCILDAPVLPYLGLPLLICGFPRPTRLWESLSKDYSGGKEVQLYSSMMPTLLHSLFSAISNGRIPPVQPSDILLARFESRLLMIRGVESWNGGYTVVVIAAELEPTSCHALEGVALDDVLNSAIGSTSRNIMNHNFFHSVLPVGVVSASGYSESQQITTGLIDDGTFINNFPVLYFKFLCYEFLHRVKFEDLLEYRDIPIHKPLIQQAKRLFPITFYDLMKSKSLKYNEYIKGMKFNQIYDFDNSLIQVIVAAFATTLGTNSSQTHATLNPSVIFEFYKGQLSFVVHNDLRTWFYHQRQTSFRVTCLNAYRYAFKHIYDSIVLQEPLSDLHLLFQEMEQLYMDWFVTIEPANQLSVEPTDIFKKTKTMLENGIQGIFYLGCKKMGEPLRVRNLTKQEDCQVKIATINSEAIKGIWANVTYELLYFTNDDDERFSIQAHQLLLRNIATQMASPPFGYPVWMAPALLTNCNEAKQVHPMNAQPRIAPISKLVYPESIEILDD